MGTASEPPVDRRQFFLAAAAVALGGGTAARSLASDSAAHPTGPFVLEATADPVANTANLQRAIDAAVKRDDPRLVVPPGNWEVTTLFLRSRLHLELSLGTVLKASPNLALFPQIQRESQRVHDREIGLHSHYVLYGDGCSDVTITGRGTIDGSGSLIPSGPSTWDPQIRKKTVLTSPTVEIRRSQRLIIQDVSVKDSPSWTIHLLDCDDVRVEGITIDNDLYGIYGDGIDLNGCRNVMVSNCYIRTCDDNICLKATRDARSCEYITVTNCVLESTCSALGIGETWNSVRYVTMSNCVVRNAIRVVQIMCDGGVVEHIVFSNISGRAMTSLGTDRVIHFDIQPFFEAPPKLGTIQHVLVSNISCETRGRILLTASDGGTMSDITIRDVRLAYPEVEDPAVSVARSGSIELSNFSPEARVARAAVVADNVTGLVLENIVAIWPEDPSRVAAPMHGIWGRRLRGGLIDCPLLTASSPSAERYDLRDSNPLIRG